MRVFIALFTLFLATTSQAASLSGGDSKTDFGAYGTYGQGLPRSPGAGLSWKVFKLGVSASTAGHSLAYQLSVTGRSRKYFISPFIGIHFNYMSVKSGDYSEEAYAGGRRGFLVTLSAGLGVEVAPDTIVDVGYTLIRGYSGNPFVTVTWPLSIE